MIGGNIHNILKTRTLIGAMLFLSGGSSLIYQVAWQRILGMYYGVGPISTAIIVSIFMLGLGMGSLIGGMLIKTRVVSLRHYLGLELGIGIFGVASFQILQALGSATAGADLWLTIVFTSIFLCIPTLMMGATFPIVIEVFSNFEKNILSNVSHLYFINTLGAALGALLGSYLAITILGLDRAIYLAASFNFTLAIAAILISKNCFVPFPDKFTISPPIGKNIKIALLSTFFTTGFLAIGYQIIWYRIIGIILKDSPYSFSSILSVYLFTMALGSRWMTKKSKNLAKHSQNNLYYKLNFLISVSTLSLIGIYILASQVWPLKDLIELLQQQMVLPVKPTESSTYLFLLSFLPVFITPLFFIGIPSFLMGASFPLASALLSDKETGNPGSNVAIAYFFTILGNTLGGLVTGFILLPHLGTNLTLGLFALVAVIFFNLLIKQKYPTKKLLTALTLVAITTLLLIPKDWLLTKLHMKQKSEQYSYLNEGIEGAVLARFISPFTYNFINGSLHGAYPGAGYFNSTFLSLSALDNSDIEALIIGYGAGSISEALLIDPRVKKVRLVEINQTLLNNFKNFDTQKKILSNPRLTIVIDDARRDLMRSNEKFDLIMMDPLRTSSQFSNNIYSQEFLILVKKHLNKNGVLMIWTDSSTILPKTVSSVFPYVDFYRNQCSFMLASEEPLAKDMNIYNNLLGLSSEYIRATLKNNVCKVPSENREDILSRTLDIPLNTDSRPVSEYYLRGYK